MEKLKKTFEDYGFENFDFWNKELDLITIDLEKMDFLNTFMRIVINRVRRYGDYAAPFFIPGGVYSGIIIGHVKDKEVIDEAKDIYKKVMVLYHQGLKFENGSEKEQIKYIKEFLSEYEPMKKRVIKLLDVCENVFKNLEEKKDEKGYLG
jgi:hypothetical protein